MLRVLQKDGGPWVGKTSPGPPPTHICGGTGLSLHKDGGRNYDAPSDNFELTFFPRRKIQTYQCHLKESEPYERKLFQQEEVNKCETENL